MKRVSPGEAVSRKFPESVVFIVSSDDEGNANVMPAGWSMFTSGDPLLLAVSVGLPRYTHTLLRDSTDFTIAFPSAAQKEDIVHCGSRSGADGDKLADSTLELLPAEEIDTPILRDAAVCFECLHHDSFLTGDHRVFVGEVVAAHLSEDYPERVKNLGRTWGNGPERFKTLSELLAMSPEDRPDPDD